MTGSVVVGLDGAPDGWACALLRLGTDGAPLGLSWSLVQTIGDALDAYQDAAAFGVDMPIGLPARGRRECDLLAKRRLGRAHSRVFLTPPRPVLDTATHPEASALHRTLVDGAGMSIQTWHLLRKVVEVDEVADDPRLVEVHPELSFAALAGLPPGEALPPKRTPHGRARRVRALQGWLPDVGETPRGTDHLDAAAAAWSAARGAAVEATVLPAVVPRDARDRPMRIVV